MLDPTGGPSVPISLFSGGPTFQVIVLPLLQVMLHWASQ